MPSLQPWIPFIVATATFACMPGPAILYMTAQTVAHGRHAGLMAALGIHLGCYFHIAAATIGLATLIESAPTAYAAIRFAGAAYLMWLGVTMFLGRSHAAQDNKPHQPNTLRHSIVVEVLNPKTALFFLTFLPQFVDTSTTVPVWLQFLVLGMVVNLVFSAADVAAVGLASVTLGRLSSTTSSWVVPKACGSILIGLGVALVTHQV